MLQLLSSRSKPMITEATEVEHIVTTLRKLVEHTERSTNADYRAYQMKLTEYNCAFIAHVHNSTSQQQRRHARDKLKSWEADFRQLSIQ